jgi:predicted nucleic acid-binding protein
VDRLGAETVVDTSVAAKFFFDEPDSDRADSVLHQCRAGALVIVVLDLLLAEFANAAWTKSLRRLATAREAESSIDHLLLLAEKFQVLPARDFLPDAVRKSCRYGHAVYDTLLLAVAERRGVPVLTADVRFYHKFRRTHPSVVLLSDLKVG